MICIVHLNLIIYKTSNTVRGHLVQVLLVKMLLFIEQIPLNNITYIAQVFDSLVNWIYSNSWGHFLYATVEKGS